MTRREPGHLPLCASEGVRGPADGPETINRVDREPRIRHRQTLARRVSQRQVSIYPLSGVEGLPRAAPSELVVLPDSFQSGDFNLQCLEPLIDFVDQRLSRKFIIGGEV